MQTEGGYFIQRFLSAKNEKHAVLGMAWFVLNHYIIRFWPWVVVAIASLMVFPTAGITSGDQEAVYVAMIREFLGPGLKGLLLVTFIAAFMSTVSTQLNWGASYLLNDVYKRFMNKNGSDKHYVSISKLITFLLTVVSGFIAFQIKKYWGCLDIRMGNELGYRPSPYTKMVLVEDKCMVRDCCTCVLPVINFIYNNLHEIHGIRA